MIPSKRVRSKSSGDGSERSAKAAKAVPPAEAVSPPSPMSQLVADAAASAPEPAASTETRPLAKLLLDAINANSKLVLPRSEPIIDIVRVPISSPILIEAERGSPLPPILELPGLVVSAQVTLRHVCLRSATDQADPLIDVRAGGHLELIDCRLEGGGIKLQAGTSARMVRTRISGSSQSGISGCDTSDISLAECEISNCDGEGLHVTSGRHLRVSDCTFSRNVLNGVLIDGKAGQASFSGCTFSANGQFGVWVDSGCSVSWSKNMLTENTLGDVGGRGSLNGWRQAATFDSGDSCVAWVEKIGEWLPAKVVQVREDVFQIMAEVPLKSDAIDASILRRTRQKAPQPTREVRTFEVEVPADAVRLPKSPEEAPPEWSKKLAAYRRRKGAFLLFLREGGTGAAAWKTLDAKERTRFQLKARKENRDKPQPSDKFNVQGAAAASAGTQVESRVQRPARKSASTFFTRTKHRI